MASHHVLARIREIKSSALGVQNKLEEYRHLRDKIVRESSLVGESAIYLTDAVKDLDRSQFELPEWTELKGIAEDHRRRREAQEKKTARKIEELRAIQGFAYRPEWLESRSRDRIDHLYACRHSTHLVQLYNSVFERLHSQRPRKPPGDSTILKHVATIVSGRPLELSHRNVGIESELDPTRQAEVYRWNSYASVCNISPDDGTQATTEWLKQLLITDRHGFLKKRYMDRQYHACNDGVGEGGKSGKRWLNSMTVEAAMAVLDSTESSSAADEDRLGETCRVTYEQPAAVAAYSCKQPRPATIVSDDDTEDEDGAVAKQRAVAVHSAFPDDRSSIDSRAGGVIDWIMTDRNFCSTSSTNRPVSLDDAVDIEMDDGASTDRSTIDHDSCSISDTQRTGLSEQASGAGDCENEGTDRVVNPNLNSDREAYCLGFRAGQTRSDDRLGDSDSVPLDVRRAASEPSDRESPDTHLFVHSIGYCSANNSDVHGNSSVHEPIGTPPGSEVDLSAIMDYLKNRSDYDTEEYSLNHITGDPMDWRAYDVDSSSPLDGIRSGRSSACTFEVEGDSPETSLDTPSLVCSPSAATSDSDGPSTPIARSSHLPAFDAGLRRMIARFHRKPDPTRLSEGSGGAVEVQTLQVNRDITDHLEPLLQPVKFHEQFNDHYTEGSILSELRTHFRDSRLSLIKGNSTDTMRVADFLDEIKSHWPILALDVPLVRLPNSSRICSFDRFKLADYVRASKTRAGGSHFACGLNDHVVLGTTGAHLPPHVTELGACLIRVLYGQMRVELTDISTLSEDDFRAFKSAPKHWRASRPCERHFAELQKDSMLYIPPWSIVEMHFHTPCSMTQTHIFDDMGSIAVGLWGQCARSLPDGCFLRPRVRELDDFTSTIYHAVMSIADHALARDEVHKALEDEAYACRS